MPRPLKVRGPGLVEPGHDTGGGRRTAITARDQLLEKVALAHCAHRNGEVGHPLVSSQGLSEQDEGVLLVHEPTLAQLSHYIQAHFS